MTTFAVVRSAWLTGHSIKLLLYRFCSHSFSGISSILGVMVVSFNFHLSLFALIPKKRGCAKSTSIVSFDVVM